MNAKLGATVILALAALSVLLLALPCALLTIIHVANNLRKPWGDLVYIFAFLMHLAYFVLLFFAVPEFFVLRRFKMRNLWAHLAVGAYSMWLFLLVSYVGASVSADRWSAKPSSDIVGLYGHVLFSNPMKLLSDTYAAGGFRGFILFTFLGAAIGWLGWRLPIYGLPGDNTRDWQPRIHTNNPADL